MKKIKEFFEEKPALSFVIAASIFLFVGFCIFLFTKGNKADPYSITGWQAIKNEGLSFWFWGLLLTAVISVVAVKVLKYFTEVDSSKFGTFWIVFGIFMAVAWGKGCTNKADNGVSSSKGRPVAVPKDTTRIPAEDLLK